MRVRLWVENLTGFKGENGRLFDGGGGHDYVDCTDLPMPTVVAGRPVYLIVELVEDGAPAAAHR